MSSDNQKTPATQQSFFQRNPFLVMGLIILAGACIGLLLPLIIPALTTFFGGLGLTIWGSCILSAGASGFISAIFAGFVGHLRAFSNTELKKFPEVGEQNHGSVQEYPEPSLKTVKGYEEPGYGGSNAQQTSTSELKQ